MRSQNKAIINEMGDQLRAGRISRDMTQEEVAVRIGVTQGVISSIERGRSKTLLDIHLNAICKVLGLNPDHVLRDGALPQHPRSRRADFEERLERMEERQLRIEALLEKLITVKRL